MADRPASAPDRIPGAYRHGGDIRAGELGAWPVALSRRSSHRRALGPSATIMNDIHLARPAAELTGRIQAKHPHHTAWSDSK